MTVRGRWCGRGAVVGALLGASVLLCGCGQGPTGPGAVQTQIRTTTLTATPTAGPVAAGPTTTTTTTTTTTGACTLLSRPTVADDLGMRLAQERVLTSGGKQIGCEFFALQSSPLATSERLPGPDQPVLRVSVSRYGTAVEAYNAMVLRAEAGTNPQQVTIARGNIGLAFQTDFYPKDHGTDWACAFTNGTALILVQTVVTSPALDAIEIARSVLRRL